MILVVFKCRNSPLDYYDTVKKFIEKMMEQSCMTKLLMNARKNNSTIPNIGMRRLNNGYRFWHKVEDRRKGFNIASTRTILRHSCTFEQSKDIQEVQSILHCKKMYCCHKVLPSIFITTESGKELRSTVNHGLIPGGVSLRMADMLCSSLL